VVVEHGPGSEEAFGPLAAFEQRLQVMVVEQQVHARPPSTCQQDDDEASEVGGCEQDGNRLFQVVIGQYFVRSLPSPSAFHSARQ
jgi:hypothetical protein